MMGHELALQGNRKAFMKRCSIFKRGYEMMPSHIIDDLKSRVSAGQITAEERFQVLTETAFKHPGDILPHLELGIFYSETKDYRNAVACLDRAHAIEPYNFWPFYYRAKIFEATREFKECLAYIRDGLEHCAGKVSDQEYANLGRLCADVKGVDSYQKIANVASDYAEPNKIGRPILSAARVSLIKDEDDIIYAGLVSSYRSGLRYFIVADNSSTDNTVAEINRFASDHPDAIVVIVVDPIVAYYQAAKTMGLARLAENVFSALGHKIDWIFPLDADEEIHIPESAEDLFSVLRQADQEEAKIIAYHFCSTASNEPIIEETRIESLPGLFTVADHPFMPLVRKVAFRISSDSVIEQGNHFCSYDKISEKQILSGADFRIYLKHYACRTVYQLRKKILNNERALKDFIGPEHFGAHWKRDIEAYNSGGDEFLVERLRNYINDAKPKTQ